MSSIEYPHPDHTGSRALHVEISSSHERSIAAAHMVAHSIRRIGSLAMCPEAFPETPAIGEVVYENVGKVEYASMELTSPDAITKNPLTGEEALVGGTDTRVTLRQSACGNALLTVDSSSYSAEGIEYASADIFDINVTRGSIRHKANGIKLHPVLKTPYWHSTTYSQEDMLLRIKGYLYEVACETDYIAGMLYQGAVSSTED